MFYGLFRCGYTVVLFVGMRWCAWLLVLVLGGFVAYCCVAVVYLGLGVGCCLLCCLLLGLGFGLWHFVVFCVFGYCCACFV